MSCWNSSLGLNRVDLISVNSNSTPAVDLSGIYSNLDRLYLNDSNLNLGISNLSMLSSNYAYLYQVSSLNSAVSNLSLISSNATIPSNLIQSISNLSMDTSNLNIGISNNKLGISSLSSLSSNYAYLYQIGSLNSAVSNLSLISSNVPTSNSLSNLANGYSNNSNAISGLSLYSSNFAFQSQITSLNTYASNNSLSLSNLNTGISNNTNYTNTLSSNLTNLSLSNVNNNLAITGLSNSLSNYTTLSLFNGSILTINSSLSNNSNNIATNSNYISSNNSLIASLSNSLSNYTNLSLFNGSILTINSSLSNNSNNIATNTSNLVTLSNCVSNNKSAINALSISSSNYAFQTQIISLNNYTSNNSLSLSNLNLGISNLSSLSSNYATSNNIMTIKNKTFDYSSNTFLNFPSGGGTGNVNTGIVNSNNFIPYWSSNNSTFLTNGIDLNTLATLTGTQTLTNKTIDYNNNTFLNLPSGSSSNVLKASQITRSNYSNSNIIRAYTTNGYTLTTSGTKIAFNLTNFNNDSNFSATTNLYTAPVTGYYCVMHNTGITNMSSRRSYATQILISGGSVNVSWVGNSTDTTNVSANNTDIYLLNAGDTVQNIINGDTAGATLNPNQAEVFMNVFLVTYKTPALPTINSGLTQSLTIGNIYNPYIARMFCNASPTISSNSLTYIYSLASFSSVVSYDLNNSITIANPSFYTCPVTGYYMVNNKVSVNNGTITTANYNISAITVNGTAVSQTYSHNVIDTSTNIYNCYTCTDIFLCNAGDTITGTYTQGDRTISLAVGSGQTAITFALITPTSTIANSSSSTPSILNTYNKYLMRATISASQTGLTAGTWTTVQFNTITYDLNSNFNTSTYTYTAPVNGYYDCRARVSMGGGVTANVKFGVALLQNSSRVSITYKQTYTTNEFGVQLNDVLYLVAGDTLKVQVYNGSTVTQQTIGFAYNTTMNFSVYLITTPTITPAPLTSGTLVLYQ
jgi:hypothetical protein